MEIFQWEEPDFFLEIDFYMKKKHCIGIGLSLGYHILMKKNFDSLWSNLS